MPKAPHASVATTEVAREPVFGRPQLEEGLLGAVVLLLPISIALARRLWMRAAGPGARAHQDEDAQRLQRVERAVESIAIEVERIGEGQRFATKLLAERRPDAVLRHETPATVPVARREVGTITPH